MIDSAFGYDTVAEIMEELESHANKAPEELATLAKDILSTLHVRSPTSLKVALRAVRKGANLSLLECLRMELGIAAAFCVSRLPCGHIIRNRNDAFPWDCLSIRAARAPISSLV
jgi:3-hydroxyisobutyryl-CoA hydrolase